MTPEEGIELGKILKAHGLKGEVLLQYSVDEPEEFIDLESVFVEINQKLIPFFIENISSPQNKKSIFKFEDIESVEATASLIGKKVFIRPQDLPEREEGAFFLTEIIGFKVNDEQLGELGKVEEIYELPGQNIISMIYKEKEVLIPINKDIILSADRNSQTLQVRLPEGLVDLYVNEENEQGKEDDED